MVNFQEKMFESTTDFDIDDDILLDTSFTPIQNSAQIFRAPKRLGDDSNKKFSKRTRNDANVVPVTNEILTENVSVVKSKSSESFLSPNRVVKRKFPGPAGLLPELGANNQSILQLLEKSEKMKSDDITELSILSQQTSSVFVSGPWNEMQADLHARNGEKLLNDFNIKWIKKQAMKQLLTYKAPFLAALIQNFDIVDGQIPTINVTLKDATGEICGTILHTLYQEYCNYFRIGSVIVIKHFGVLSSSHRNHCLTITHNNLISVYCQETPPKLPGDNNEDCSMPSRSTGDTVKKVVIQDCDVEEILRRYNEDVALFAEEKRKMSVGNSSKNCDNQHTSSFNTKNSNFVKTGTSLASNIDQFRHTSNKNVNVASTSRPTTSFNTENVNFINTSRLLSSNINQVPHSSSKDVYAASTSKCDVNNSTHFVVGSPSIQQRSPQKKKFCFKQFSSGANVTSQNEDIKEESTSKKVVRSENADIWKSLTEGVDIDSLFNDF